MARVRRGGLASAVPVSGLPAPSSRGLRRQTVATPAHKTQAPCRRVLDLRCVMCLRLRLFPPDAMFGRCGSG